MKKISCALLWFSIPVFIALLPAVPAWCQTNPIEEMFQSISALELQVKIVMKDDTFINNDFYDEYTGEHREHSEERDKLDVTIEGTFKFKAYPIEIPDLPPEYIAYCSLPTSNCPPIETIYPRGPLLVPDWLNTPTPSINGSGQGDSSNWSIRRQCKVDEPNVCQDFKQEGTANWQYRTEDSAYAIGRPIENGQSGMVRDLLVRQLSAGAPVSYTFDLRPVGINDYIKGSGTGTTTTRGFETNETTSYPIEHGAGFAAPGPSLSINTGTARSPGT